MSFTDTVYDVTAQIPKGNVATYGQIAKLAGKPKAARIVGSLMKINPFAPRVPCHRVVGFDGNLIGYSGKNGITGKRSMLIKEGVVFKGNKVDLARSLWRR